MATIRLDGDFESQRQKIIGLKEGELEKVEIDRGTFLDQYTLQERRSILGSLSKIGIPNVTLTSEWLEPVRYDMESAALNEKLERGYLTNDLAGILSGLTPERIISKKIFKDYPDLETALGNQEELLLVESYLDDSVHIISIPAAKWIVQNHPSLFPIEEKTNLTDWLKSFLSKGSGVADEYLSDLQYGLLSGFETKSCEDLSRWKMLIDRIILQLETKDAQKNSELITKVKKLRSRGISGDNKLAFSEIFRAELKSHSVEVSDEDWTLITTESIRVTYGPDYPGGFSFSSFDEQAQSRLDRELAERISHCKIEANPELKKFLV
jgi:hypothetical protein